VRFHFTPTYSSWLNQVKLWFAKIQRDVIRRGVFTSVADLGKKLRRYIRAYSNSAKPFAGPIPIPLVASAQTKSPGQMG
jgi:DDE superfamily endonuclease